VLSVAEVVREAAEDELGTEVDVELVENPRAAETMVEEFGVDTSKAQSNLGWVLTYSVSGSVNKLFSDEEH